MLGEKSRLQLERRHCFVSLAYSVSRIPLILSNLDETILHRLSVALILHPIGAGLGGIALIFGLLGICAASRFLTILMSITAFLAALTTLVIFIIDMVLFNVLKNKLSAAGINASLVSVIPPDSAIWTLPADL